MFGNDNSKKNQRAAETSYRFGAFELHPGERFLKRDGEPVPLTGKAFEALLWLVRNGAHLVRKDELMTALWPETFVSEANLTNIIVSLRKILGRDAIQTVSKHGYRFTLTVQSEPGITRETYATFVRAKELTLQRSLDAVTQARGLYWICLADDPGLAVVVGFWQSSVAIRVVKPPWPMRLSAGPLPSTRIWPVPISSIRRWRQTQAWRARLWCG
jgi:DNA-binding winged helix-turn-helix (wHTH) protein